MNGMISRDYKSKPNDTFQIEFELCSARADGGVQIDQ